MYIRRLVLVLWFWICHIRWVIQHQTLFYSTNANFSTYTSKREKIALVGEYHYLHSSKSNCLPYGLSLILDPATSDESSTEPNEFSKKLKISLFANPNVHTAGLQYQIIKKEWPTLHPEACLSSLILDPPLPMSLPTSDDEIMKVILVWFPAPPLQFPLLALPPPKIIHNSFRIGGIFDIPWLKVS